MQKNVEPHVQDEIDLMELLARFYSLLKKNAALAIIFPLSGVLVAVLLNILTPNRIASEMMIEPVYLSETECNFLMNQYEEADSIPGLDEDRKKVIVDISHQIQKTEGNDFSLKIRAVVKRYNALPELQKLIVEYLNSSEPVIRKQRNQEVYLTQLIKEIDKELDSLQQVKSKIDNATKVTFLNPSDLFVRAVDLYDKKIQYEIRLKDNTGVKVVQGFTAMPKDAKLNKTYSLLIGFLIGCLALAVILFFKFFNSYYRKYQSSD